MSFIDQALHVLFKISTAVEHVAGPTRVTLVLTSLNFPLRTMSHVQVHVARVIHVKRHVILPKEEIHELQCIADVTTRNHNTPRDVSQLRHLPLHVIVQ